VTAPHAPRPAPTATTSAPTPSPAAPAAPTPAPGSWTRAEVARLIDHTLLRPEATAADVERLCTEAAELGVGAVCVSPSLLPLRAGLLPAGVGVAAVVGFPSGAHLAGAKAAEAQAAVACGATEIDMVANLALVASGALDELAAEVERVTVAVGPTVPVKVILETSLWDPERIAAACLAAAAGGAAFVKTSTGFHPAGGASVEAVAVMAATVGDRLGVKASGGIRSAADARRMLEAGATRLGASATAAILAGF
jgi:deoxyribose-phosphate aldolase